MDLQEIGKQINTLDKQHHIEILRILVKHNITINENKNGIFVNLSVLEKPVIDDIAKHLEHVRIQEKTLTDTEKQMDNYNKKFFAETV